ncbi:MAG: class I SAM-dependent methyltransferase [Flavobacteriales bacterium]|jgi:SAM-dependent methyltransferase|nr:class I SAM-dependent methyltransferase [Flavobacteriales bacterium]
MDVEKIRLDNTFNDLKELNAKCYCDLGPGYGEIPIALKNAGKNVIFVESEWNEYLAKEWGTKEDIKYYIKDFLLDDFGFFEEEVDCFSLVHCIAHFHLPPQLLFEQVYKKLPKGGYFYISTVNGSSLSRVMKLFRGQPITGLVTKEADPNNFTNVYLSRMLGIDRHMTVSDWMHVKEYTKPELEQMLIAENFKIHKSIWRNNFTHWKQRLASAYRKSLSEEIVIIAQK